VDRRKFLLGAAGAAAGTAAAAAGAWKVYDRAENPGRDPSAPRHYGDIVLKRKKASSDAPNVLMLALDDCNDWLGFLNNYPGTKTPNLDALAATSVVFSQAYCAAPMCLPSRTAALFGQNPWVTKIYNHSPESRRNYERMVDFPSVIDDIWAAGYDVIAGGKVFNGSERKRWTEFHRTDTYLPGVGRKDPNAKADTYDPKWLSPYDGKPIGRGEHFSGDMVDFGPSGRAPADDPDGRTVTWIDEHLTQKRSRPFLLALGMTTTHEPWRVPQKFFDMHPLDKIVVPDTGANDLDDLSEYARKLTREPADIFGKLERAHLWKNVVQAYQAAISYADDRIGVVLDQLASSRYADDTVVVVWSDHGYHLGEKMHLEKFTLWERATHIPFVLRVPGRYGHRTVDVPVSLMDMAPTLVELCGATVSRPNFTQSLLPVIDHPERARSRPPIMTWQAGNHAVRSGPWRYIRYVTGDKELYDHRTDPNEITNLAADPAHAGTMSTLDRFLPRT
jgi:arylsulfatase A-like enzyme